MWGANAAAPLNSAHFGYGIGAIFVNLLVRPFLSQMTSSMNPTASKGVNITESSANMTATSSIIVFPYSITAALCALIAVGHLFFYIRELRKRREKLDARQVIVD